jgi:hypothetical protein
MPSKAGPFTFAELQTITCLSRGEIRECIKRGIISAPADVGQGNHRAYSKWNLVEGVIAAALLRHIRAGWVEGLMMNLRVVLMAHQIDPEIYCSAPDAHLRHFELLFPPRTKPDGEAGSGEKAGSGGFLIATASKVRGPDNDPSVAFNNSSDPFCQFTIDLEKAVSFVNFMIESKL